MSDKANKLLQHARSAPNGWMKVDLEKLYVAFGFIIEEGSSHTIASHPDHLELVGTIRRSSKELSPAYVKSAVSLIDQLILLESKNG
ncbi:MAG: hypothetical protein AAGU25_03360 [bacterium]